MIVPDECIKYIRWQRSRFIAAKVPDPAEVKRRYVEWVDADFSGMLPHLPEKVESILEIGCGMAGLQVHMKRKFPDAKLWLLDGDGNNIAEAGTSREVGVGGWQEKLKPYNSRKHTEMLLGANGVKVDRWIDVGTKELLEADLIISTASLGFHYPFHTYNLKGFVICDLRRTNEAALIDRIRATGGKIIFNGPKYERCAFWMPIESSIRSEE